MFEARIRWPCTPAIKRCLANWPNNADFLALMREKVAAVYTLIK
jgi:hypothetical protein